MNDQPNKSTQAVSVEAERMAYTRGQTQTAALYARIHDLERELDDAQTTIEELTEDVDRLHQELLE
tara:strand:- start:6362 stop:6559 length:198 start_codon:yes stop_codon:yes gene_type:complete